MPIAPGEFIRSAEVLGALALKADLDPQTGKVRLSQLPDILGQNNQAALAAAEAAQATADRAEAAAGAAQATADAAVPGAALGVSVATLGPDGKLDPAQVPDGLGGGGTGPAYTPPTAATFSSGFVNRGTTEVTEAAGWLRVLPELQGASAGNLLRGVFAPLPAAPYTVEVVMLRDGLDYPFFTAGVALRNSATGAFHSLTQGASYYDGGGYQGRDEVLLMEAAWSNSGYIAGVKMLACDGREMHFRIRDAGDGLGPLCFFRRDAGSEWVPTWGGPAKAASSFDQAGLAFSVASAGSYIGYPRQPVRFVHWSVTAG